MECCNKVGSRDRIQLRRWFIQQKDFRIHNHYGSQIQKLFLTARKRNRIPKEKIFHSEIACHFRHASADLVLRKILVFQSERQLVPNLICHDLLLGMLHNVSNLRGASRFGNCFSVQKNLSLVFTDGRKFFFQKAQKRGFSASRCSAYGQKFSFLHRKRKIFQRKPFAHRITKA